MPSASAEGVTRHPGAGAAEELSVAGGEPLRNEQLLSLAAVFGLPRGSLLIRFGRPVCMSHLSLISGCLFRVGRSFERGKGALLFFLPCRAVRGGARRPPCGRRALERRGDSISRSARERAGQRWL
jgi:hypothetical protein